MSSVFRCPHCKVKIQASDESQYKIGRCPRCKTKIMVVNELEKNPESLRVIYNGKRNGSGSVMVAKRPRLKSVALEKVDLQNDGQNDGQDDGQEYLPRKFILYSLGLVFMICLVFLVAAVGIFLTDPKAAGSKEEGAPDTKTNSSSSSGLTLDCAYRDREGIIDITVKGLMPEYLLPPWVVVTGPDKKSKKIGMIDNNEMTLNGICRFRESIYYPEAGTYIFTLRSWDLKKILCRKEITLRLEKPIIEIVNAKLENTYKKGITLEEIEMTVRNDGDVTIYLIGYVWEGDELSFSQLKGPLSILSIGPKKTEKAKIKMSPFSEHKKVFAALGDNCLIRGKLFFSHWQGAGSYDNKRWVAFEKTVKLGDDQGDQDVRVNSKGIRPNSRGKRTQPLNRGWERPNN